MEGIIQASDKTKKTFDKITNETVSGYVEWFFNKNIINQHIYYFFNVPAPMYDPKYSKEINNKVAGVIGLFNSSLLEKTSALKINLIDVYGPTINDKGFSNRKYHCDNIHLDIRILPLIQYQLNRLPVKLQFP